MNEVHICSCVVHARPEYLQPVAQAIRSQQLAEIPALDERGRIVVVMEGSSAGAVLDRIDQLRALPGVVAVNLVYQHAETESALQEPLS